MERIDVVNLVSKMVNESAGRYNGLKSETALAKEYSKINGSAQSLSTSIGGLETEKILIKYNLIDRRFKALEKQYTELSADALAEISIKDKKAGTDRSETAMAIINEVYDKSMDDMILKNGLRNELMLILTSCETYEKMHLPFILDINNNAVMEICQTAVESAMTDEIEQVKRNLEIVQRMYYKFQVEFNESPFAKNKELKKVTNPLIREVQVNVPKQQGQATFKLSRGGSRDGSGRKKLGITTKISVTLEQEDWDFIDDCVQHDSNVNSRSAFFRHLYLSAYHPNSARLMEFSKKGGKNGS